MGFETFGFAGGREDVWEPDEDVYWGPETEWLGDERYSGERDLEEPFGAVQMGLIYVNPEGPNGNPDPLKAAVDIRETFARMAMNDEETVALIAGGHTFGKTHGAADPLEYVGAEPEGAPLEAQGLGWSQQLRHRQGRGRDHQRHRGDLDRHADAVEQQLLRQPLRLRVGADQEPRRRAPVAAQGRRRGGHVPGPEEGSERRPPTMLTTDLSLRLDPVYGPISKRFHENPAEFADAFARAWFKLTHRDMGPIERYLGPEVPSEELIWQDPVPKVDHELISAEDAAELKQQILDSGLSVSELVSTAWASASTFRGSDKRGGANGARIRLEPQRSWEVNDPEQLAHGAGQARGDPGRLRQAGLARRPDRARGLRGRRAGGPRRGRRARGAVHAGPHGRHGGADGRRLVRAAGAHGGRVPQLPAGRATGSAPSTCCSTARTC